MQETRPFLSICIPTFNRAETLRKSLGSFTSDEGFTDSDDVEIVISDNCSTDHTEQVARGFMEKFPGRIRYSKTESNVFDLNLERALQQGRGRFLKLQTDSFGVRPGLLKPWVAILKALEAEKPVVFMLNQVPERDDDLIKQFHDLDGFLAEVSFHCTWGGGFGIWAEDFQSFNDFSRDSALRLVQTDVVLRMAAAKKNVVVIKEFIQPSFGTGRKSGYNIAEVFGANYLSILRRHLEDGALSEAVYSAEKRRVLIEHILPFIVNPNHDFQHDNLMHHLRDYHGEPYFLPALEAVMNGSDVGQGVTGSVSSSVGAVESFAQQWRRLNSHNETTCGYPLPVFMVAVGRRTYGQINALHWGHPNEGLRIGHFCSIGGGVEFILGGNHAMDGFSTFPWKVKYFGDLREAQTKGQIVVGDDVWIGNRATILSGSRIGQGAVIAANAVVSGEVPPYAVMAGNPARIVRKRFPDAVIAELLRLDYAKLSDRAILGMADRLYEPINEQNVREIVDTLMAGTEMVGSTGVKSLVAEPSLVI